MQNVKCKGAYDKEIYLLSQDTFTFYILLLPSRTHRTSARIQKTL